VRHLLVALVLVLGAAPPAAAQRAVRLDVELPAQPGRSGPRVRAVGVLADARLRDLLRNGFPTRLHFRTELWSTGGWLNDFEGAAEWDVVVRYDPLDASYQVVRVVGDRVTSLGRYPELAQAQAAVERPYAPSIRVPRLGRRYYYNARVEVEPMSVNDLDEVERWLRGELRPAVRGERNPGTALGRGVGQLLVRLIGGERRELEARSGTFVAQ
jgi:hypothetical protein